MEEKERCNCDASCGENRYHNKGDPGCVYYVGEDKSVQGALSKSSFSQEDFDARARRTLIHEMRQYWTLLRHHDWQYNYSDDHSVWQKGSAHENELRRHALKSPAHQQLFDQFKAWSAQQGGEVPDFPLRYLCDNARHMVCEPFSVPNLHRMAAALGLKRNWFHTGKFPHYDMPKKRVEELTAQCERTTQKQILLIIKAGVK